MLDKEGLAVEVEGREEPSLSYIEWFTEEANDEVKSLCSILSKRLNDLFSIINNKVRSIPQVYMK